MRFKPHGPQKPQRALCGPVWRITSSHKSHTPLIGVWLMWSECACGHWASCSWEGEKIRRGEPRLCLGASGELVRGSNHLLWIVAEL
jgi:hypothetical protein